MRTSRSATSAPSMRAAAREKADGGLGWKTQAWKQALFENMNIVIARSNNAMLAMHTLPAEPR